MTMWLWRCGSERERAITRSVNVIGVSDGFNRAGGHGDPPLQKNIVGTIHELSDSIGRCVGDAAPYIGFVCRGRHL